MNMQPLCCESALIGRDSEKKKKHPIMSQDIICCKMLHNQIPALIKRTLYAAFTANKICVYAGVHMHMHECVRVCVCVHVQR